MCNLINIHGYIHHIHAYTLEEVDWRKQTAETFLEIFDGRDGGGQRARVLRIQGLEGCQGYSSRDPRLES